MPPRQPRRPLPVGCGAQDWSWRLRICQTSAVSKGWKALWHPCEREKSLGNSPPWWRAFVRNPWFEGIYSSQALQGSVSLSGTCFLFHFSARHHSLEFSNSSCWSWAEEEGHGWLFQWNGAASSTRRLLFWMNSASDVGLIIFKSRTRLTRFFDPHSQWTDKQKANWHRLVKKKKIKKWTNWAPPAVKEIC